MSENVLLSKSTIIKSIPKFEFINFLRGIAILGVLLVHVSNNFSIRFLPNILILISKDGRYGVQLFFFASAFTMFYSYDNRSYDPNVNVNFFIRRFFRIVPLYYLALIYYAIQGLVSPNNATEGIYAINALGIIENMFFIHGIDPRHINNVVPGGWSIAVEMSFYCLIPILYKHIKDINGSLIFLAFTLILRRFFFILMIHFVKLYIPEKDLFEDFLYYYLPNQLPVFAIGILFYFIVKGEFNISSKSLLVIFLLAVAEIIKNVLDLADHILLTFSFLFLATALRKVKMIGCLYKAIQQIGMISYSVYLAHFGIIHIFLKLHLSINPSNVINNLLYFSLEYIGVLLATIAIASLIYKYIEVPFQNIGKNIIKAKT